MNMLHPASGGASFAKASAKVIRFVRKGCANRPFFHIVVTEKKKDQFDPVIEQVGTYDPYPNQNNEKLVSLNFERIRYWVGSGAEVTKPIEELLGLSGFFPINPRTYRVAWRNREALHTTSAEDPQN